MEISRYYPIVTESEQKLPFYITTIGITENEKRIYRPDGISYFQLLFSDKGCGNANINGHIYHVAQGSMLVLPPHMPHDYCADCDNWTTSWVTFNATVKLFDFAAGVYQLPSDFDFTGRINNIICFRNTIEWKIKSSTLLYELLLECSEYLTENTALYPGVRAKLSVCFKYIEENVGNVIELADMAKSAEVSAEHLCRIFKAYTGMRPFEYINKIRVQRAKEYMLSYPESDIKTIAAAVGFQSESYFSKIFRKKVGKTAGEYRKEHINY